MLSFQFRYRLRALLVLMVLVAVGTALWRIAPSPDLAVTVRSDLAMATLNGQRIPLDTLSQEVRREARWRRLWLRDCIVHLNVQDPLQVKPLQDSMALAGAFVQTVRMDQEVSSQPHALAVLKTLAEAKVPLRTIKITEDSQIALELFPVP